MVYPAGSEVCERSGNVRSAQSVAAGGQRRQAFLRGWAPHPVSSRYKRLTQPGSKGSGGSCTAQPTPHLPQPSWWNKPVPTPRGGQMWNMPLVSAGLMELLQGFFSSYVFCQERPRRWNQRGCALDALIVLHHQQHWSVALNGNPSAAPGRNALKVHLLSTEDKFSLCDTLIYPLQVPLQAWSSFFFGRWSIPRPKLHPPPTCVEWITVYWQQTPEELLTINPSVCLLDSFIRVASVWLQGSKLSNVEEINLLHDARLNTDYFWSLNYAILNSVIFLFILQ